MSDPANSSSLGGMDESFVTCDSAASTDLKTSETNAASNAPSASSAEPPAPLDASWPAAAQLAESSHLLDTSWPAISAWPAAEDALSVSSFALIDAAGVCRYDSDNDSVPRSVSDENSVQSIVISKLEKEKQLLQQRVEVLSALASVGSASQLLEPASDRPSRRAVKIQAAMRRAAAVRRLQRLRAAAIFVQSHARGALARTRTQERMAAAVSLQAAVRLHLRLRRRAASVLQRVARRFLAAMRRCTKGDLLREVLRLRAAVAEEHQKLHQKLQLGVTRDEPSESAMRGAAVVVAEAEAEAEAEEAAQARASARERARAEARGEPSSPAPTDEAREWAAVEAQAEAETRAEAVAEAQRRRVQRELRALAQAQAQAAVGSLRVETSAATEADAAEADAAEERSQRLQQQLQNTTRQMMHLVQHNQRLQQEKVQAEDRASQLYAEALLLEGRVATLSSEKTQAQELASRLCAERLQASFEKAG